MLWTGAFTTYYTCMMQHTLVCMYSSSQATRTGTCAWKAKVSKSRVVAWGAEGPSNITPAPSRPRVPSSHCICWRSWQPSTAPLGSACDAVLLERARSSHASTTSSTLCRSARACGTAHTIRCSIGGGLSMLGRRISSNERPAGELADQLSLQSVNQHRSAP